jgi:hypothetical protein
MRTAAVGSATEVLHSSEIGRRPRTLRVRVISLAGEPRVVLQALAHGRPYGGLSLSPNRLAGLIAALNEASRYVDEKGLI